MANIKICLYIWWPSSARFLSVTCRILLQCKQSSLNVIKMATGLQCTKLIIRCVLYYIIIHKSTDCCEDASADRSPCFQRQGRLFSVYIHALWRKMFLEPNKWISLQPWVQLMLLNRNGNVFLLWHSSSQCRHFLWVCTLFFPPNYRET